MKKFLLDAPLSPREELLALLEYNGIEHISREDEARLVFSEGNFKWETVCRYAKNAVIIYGVYPFEGKAGTELLNNINSELIRGAMLQSGETVVMRTSADLFDSYSSYEAIARALEYNAGAVVKYWHKISNAVYRVKSDYNK